MSERKTTEEFIEDARKICGDRYDYSKVEYVNNKTKVIIVCKEHGEFEQVSGSHLGGKGCPKCGKFKTKPKKTVIEFIENARKVHGDRYDYSKSVYDGNNVKLIISCKEHGEFLQTPNSHVSKGSGCPECAKIKVVNFNRRNRKNINDLIEQFNLIHNNKYDYSKFKYINNRTKGIIICNDHGSFKQVAYVHLKGHECPKCANETRKRTNLERYGVESPSQCEEIRKKMKKTNLERYGVEYATQNSEIFKIAQKNSYEYKEHTTPSGRIIKLQGYEPQGYKLLLEEYNEDDILHKRSEIPTIWYYTDDNKKHRYYPDFFISKDNLIVEVKSTWTYEVNLEVNLLKQQACLDNGYKFKFMILEG